MPIETARSIGKLGFTRWYERQLLESHAWLVTCLLLAIVLGLLLETVSFKQHPFLALATCAFVYALGIMCWQAFRRYRIVAMQAQHLDSQTTCSGCGTHARFQALDSNPRMRVRCRECSQEWVID
jgi:hypothetical protein